MTKDILRKHTQKVAVRLMAGYGDHVPLEIMAEALRNTGYTVVAND